MNATLAVTNALCVAHRAALLMRTPVEAPEPTFQRRNAGASQPCESLRQRLSPAIRLSLAETNSASKR